MKDHPLVQRGIRIAAFKIGILEKFLLPIVLLAIRLYVGKFFWQSGQTKIVNLESAQALFSSEYIPNWEKNHVKEFLGTTVSFPVPGAEFATLAATAGELILSALLIAGFFGRFSAFGIFMMTLSIEMFVYPGTQEHYYWLLTMAVIVACGPGKLSLDHYLRRYFIGA